MNYATIDDISSLWREMTSEEQTKAEALIPIVCDTLRQEAMNVGRDLDVMIACGKVLPSVVKSVVVDVVARSLLASTDQEPMTQFSQSALGYSFTGTYLNSGGGIFIKKSELARLGIKRQTLRTISMI